MRSAPNSPVNVLDGAITAFAEKVDELEFSHLLGQPHYLGFLGFHGGV